MADGILSLRKKSRFSLMGYESGKKIQKLGLDKSDTSCLFMLDLGSYFMHYIDPESFQ